MSSCWAFADHEGIARDAAGLVNQGRGGRPAGIVQHGVVQRRQDALERGRLAHVPQNTKRGQIGARATRNHPR